MCLWQSIVECMVSILLAAILSLKLPFQSCFQFHFSSISAAFFWSKIDLVFRPLLQALFCWIFDVGISPSFSSADVQVSVLHFDTTVSLAEFDWVYLLLKPFCKGKIGHAPCPLMRPKILILFGMVITEIFCELPMCFRR